MTSKAKLIGSLTRERYFRGIRKKIWVASQPNFNVEGWSHPESFSGFSAAKTLVAKDEIPTDKLYARIG